MGNDVRNYYDRNTRGFLRFGGASGVTGSLHRSLRTPDGASRTDQLNAIHRIILDLLVSHRTVQEIDRVHRDRSKLPPLVADLGCGVGATLSWLAGRADIEAVGITVSQVQAAIAARRLGPGGRVVSGSFLIESDIETMAGGRNLDAAYMIESFVHATEASRLFSVLSAHTAPDGLLLICDDFPSERLLHLITLNRTSRAVSVSKRLAAEFRRGWHIGTFMSPADVTRLASRFGFVELERIDLSPFVVTNRPRDVVARSFAPVARFLKLRSPWWSNVIGGSALQRLSRKGLMKYQLLVFQRKT